mmetsp:Transcript_47777/g.126474  ORF Transcript_47777/g.126474 Transcript_47777/m.126474 type:complete len:253 (+) Transcript_47777:1753-2511(+)
MGHDDLLVRRASLNLVSACPRARTGKKSRQQHPDHDPEHHPDSAVKKNSVALHGVVREVPAKAVHRQRDHGLHEGEADVKHAVPHGGGDAGLVANRLGQRPRRRPREREDQQSHQSADLEEGLPASTGVLARVCLVGHPRVRESVNQDLYGRKQRDETKRGLWIVVNKKGLHPALLEILRSVKPEIGYDPSSNNSCGHLATGKTLSIGVQQGHRLLSAHSGGRRHRQVRRSIAGLLRHLRHGWRAGLRNEKC